MQLEGLKSIHSAMSELSAKMTICPGNGCNEALVDEIVADLKRRMKARGDTGQIQRAEQMLDEVRRVGADVAEIKANVQAIMDHLKVEWRPAVVEKRLMKTSEFSAVVCYPDGTPDHEFVETFRLSTEGAAVARPALCLHPPSNPRGSAHAGPSRCRRRLFVPNDCTCCQYYY